MGQRILKGAPKLLENGSVIENDHKFHLSGKERAYSK
jgi:hypothetical protein